MSRPISFARRRERSGAGPGFARAAAGKVRPASGLSVSKLDAFALVKSRPTSTTPPAGCRHCCRFFAFPRNGIRTPAENPQYDTISDGKFTSDLRGLRGARECLREGIPMNQKMRDLYELAERVARGKINVLITGETGVGKEVLAHRLHEVSPRVEKPFVALNCSALPESLAESELFGHERGAFTGAAQAKSGLLETASGGTLFLDEVGEMLPSLQTKLLRVLETQQFLRVGGTKPRRVDVRLVAATNRDLEDQVAKGAFRQDLYFRLAAVTLVIPPLRERADEIEPLTRKLVTRICQQDGQPTLDIDPDALDLLRAYDWPGNIRELRNVLERAILLAADGRVRRENLPTERMERAIARLNSDPFPSDGDPIEDSIPVWRQRIAAIERRAILDALEQCDGNKAHAAGWLRMPRSTFFARLKAHKIN
jgi:two-component system, NtrC family, response regulator AtoC